MADNAEGLQVGHIVAIACSGVFVLIAIAVVSLILVYIYHRKLFCFKRRAVVRRPKIYTQEEIEKGLTRKRRLQGLKGQLHSKLHPGHRHKKKSAYPFEEDREALLENPMLDPDIDNVDFSNPVFDHEKAKLRDAAIAIQAWYRMWRRRVPYLQLRESALIVQSVWRGYCVRKTIPELRRQKKELQQRRRGSGASKKKGGLSQLKFYDVKAFGFAVVEQLYGLETIRNAAEQLKAQYGSKGKMRLKLFISVKGIKLFDAYTFQHYATVKIASVSFCTMDPRNRRLFAFINRRKKRNFCHVFHCMREGDAHRMVETLAESFEITFKQLQKERETEDHRRRQLLVKRRVPSGAGGSQVGSMAELDEEVENMMYLAKGDLTGGTPRIKPASFQQVAEVHPNSGSLSSLSSTASAEKGILIKPHQTMMSSLATTARHSPMFQRGVQTSPSADVFTNTVAVAESADEEEDGEDEDEDEDEEEEDDDDEDDLSAEDQ